MVDEFKKNELDYYSNVNPPTYPDGIDVEIFKRNALVKLDREIDDVKHREHVTSGLREAAHYKKMNKEYIKNMSDIRLTIDEQRDLEVIRKIDSMIKNIEDAKWEDIADLYSKDYGNWGNEEIKRNDGQIKSTGEKMWNRAKKVIGGGNMLLSKRPDMHLPGTWPTYYQRSTGCLVYDLDGKEYKDVYLMGVGTNILGYANERVDIKVKDVVMSGNMSTLNCLRKSYWLKS